MVAVHALWQHRIRMGGARRNRVAFITGGTRGIGAAVTRRLATDGVSVALTYLSRSDDADRIVAELSGAGFEALAIRADVSDPGALLAAMDTAVAHFGQLDILVNNAGLAIVGPLSDYAPDAFDRVFALNVKAPFLAAQKAASLMGEGGRIITIGSIVADRMPGAGGTLYAASKSALGGLTRSLARDFGDRGITVILVQPVPIDTESNPANGPTAVAIRWPLAIKRHGTAEEVAGLVAYLASDAAAFVTGSTYNIDGGWSA